MQKTEVMARIRSGGLIPILRTTSAADALAITGALREAGIGTVEIPLTVPDAVDVIAELVHRDDGLLVGAGSVLDVEAASTVIAAGVSFVFSPSLDVEVVQYCNSVDVAVFPGALSPGEIVAAWKAGADMVKVFPCQAVGGPAYIKAVKAPLPHIEMCPTGGVSLQNAAAFIEAGATALGVGADLVDLQSVHEGRLDRIAERARLYVELVKEMRAAHDAITPPPPTTMLGRVAASAAARR